MNHTSTDLAYFYPAGHEAHVMAGHVERPERVEIIRKTLQASGWWDNYPKLEPLDIPEAVLHTVHDPGWILRLESLCHHSSYLGLDTYITPSTYRLALHAAGGAAAVACAVWRRDFLRGFALTRPPGHHATYRQGGGFCYLNNIALAAEMLIQNEQARRLAIVDYDLHHGNGTQDIFWKRSDVLYISTHQVPLYPGSGWLDEVGEGSGEGATANFPLIAGSGDQAFQTISSELIFPLLDRFSPEMILVSFGFDTHWRDPLGSLLLSAGVYQRLISNLASWAEQNCRGRILLVLEGGYDLQAASACSAGVTAALLGQDWGDPLGPSPDDENMEWQSMVDQAKHIWRL